MKRVPRVGASTARLKYASDCLVSTLPIPERRRTFPSMKLITSLLFYLLSLTLGSVNLWVGLQAIEEGYRSNEWPCVEGVIERFRKTDHWSHRYSRFRGSELTFFYSFNLNDTRYEGYRLTTDDLFYGSVFLQGLQSGKRLLSRYAPGTQVSVCYDPAAPADSALLNPGLHFGAIVRTLIGVFFLVLAGAVAFFERKRRGP